MAMKAWQLLSNKGAWIKGAFARDEEGYCVSSTNPDACCWCAIGAVRKCYPAAEVDDIVARIAAKIPRLYHGDVAQWNDKSIRRQSQVVKVLKALDI